MNLHGFKGNQSPCNATFFKDFLILFKGAAGTLYYHEKMQSAYLGLCVQLQVHVITSYVGKVAVHEHKYSRIWRGWGNVEDTRRQCGLPDSLGSELSSKLTDLALMLHYLPLDDRSMKSPYEGWEESCTMQQVM